MTRELQMWIFPLLALVLGLVLFATSKDKWATIGGYVFLCGFFILLWLVSFGEPLAGRLQPLLK